MKLLILFFTGCCLFNGVLAQSDNRKFRTMGGDLGYAINRNDIDYNVFMLAADFSQSFRAPRKKVYVSWYFQPQFNIADAPSDRIAIEFGANLGIRNYIKVNDVFYLFQMVGSGPHFITADVTRQAKGFIFSDNIAVGSFIHLSKSYFLRLQAGLRHISNAGLKEPNLGIDSFLFTVGISRIK